MRFNGRAVTRRAMVGGMKQVDLITIQNSVPTHAPCMAEVQARCVAACPDTSQFPPGFWHGPGFEDGRNIFCAVDGQGELLGYAAITPSYISRHLDARVLWIDLRADPARVDADAIKDILFGKAYGRAQEIARRQPDEKSALSATYFSEGQASIEYLSSKGFRPYQTCYAMRRDLSAPLPPLPVPSGVQVRPWRMGTEQEQQAYLNAYDAAFGDESKNLEELQHFMKSEYWSAGTTFTAFAGDRVVGSVAVWHHPRSKGAGKTEAVFVIPGWRRQGLARYLLREGMRYLRERGLAYAELEMDSTNAPALALYESLGYRVFKEEVSMGLPLNGKDGP
jgi:ribosomal protein S18 acetylase RimI-like enzyme